MSKAKLVEFFPGYPMMTLTMTLTLTLKGIRGSRIFLLMKPPLFDPELKRAGNLTFVYDFRYSKFASAGQLEGQNKSQRRKGSIS